MSSVANLVNGSSISRKEIFLENYANEKYKTNNDIDKAIQYAKWIEDEISPFVKIVTERFLDRYGELFSDSFFMLAPNVQLDKDTVMTSHPVHLGVKVHMNISEEDEKSQQETEDENEAIDLIVDQLKEAFVGEMKHLDRHGFVMCPYILLTATKTLSPDTFDPMIAFMTRYGVTTKEQKEKL